jgi:DNA polymerase III epsilon subunit-like protein
MSILNTQPLKKAGEKTVNFPIKKLELWRDSLGAYALKYGAIYAVSDTETTGTRIVDSRSGLLNRLLEWSICFCYKDTGGFLHPCLDKDGTPIVIDEPTNPFITKPTPTAKQKRSVIDIDPESIAIHGITLDYLFAKGEGAPPAGSDYARPLLSGTAPSFSTVMDLFQSILNIDPIRNAEASVFGVFHKADFDISFLNHECECWDIPHVESYMGVIDTLALSKKIISPEDINAYTLDAIYQFGKDNYPDVVHNVERPIHSALIDSMILVQVYNILWSHFKNNKQK